MPPTNANPLSNAANPSKEGASLRPPLYNPEDYCGALRMLFTSSLTLHHMSPPPTSLILEHSSTPSVIPGAGLIDMNKRQEMSMKKFINGSELLFKLEADLRSAFPSFVQEFVSGESDGVTCILDALRNIHEALDHVQGLREQRKLVLDERSCVQCISLMMKHIDAIPRLLGYAHGLYPIVHCTVSTNTSTRVLALDILSSVLEQGGNEAFAKVSEAISTLRLRLGEPIRCKVLVGAISSASAGVFQASGVRFLRSFVESSPSSKFRVYLQVELEEAGFNVEVIRKSAELSPARESRLVVQEIEAYERVCVDVDTVVRQNSQLRNSVATLQQEIATLKDRIKKDHHQPQHHVQKFKKHAPRNSAPTPINHIVTPVDSEEEAEQIHQILEDLHNIVNNEMLNSNESSSSTNEIVPVMNTRLLPRYEHNPPRPVRSEPNLFNSDASTVFTNGSDNEHDSPSVKHVVQQLENSNVFQTLPNFNTTNLGLKFANFKSSKLDSSKGWGEPETEPRTPQGFRVKSLENLDNFTLKWKYPVPTQDKQPNSLVVLQDYRMNRFGGSGGSGSGGKGKKSPQGSSSGLFNKRNKKRQNGPQVINHAQKTFMISKKDEGFNDLGGGGSSPSLLERVTDLPSGMY